MKRNAFTAILCCLILFWVSGSATVSAENADTVEDIFGGIVISAHGNEEIQSWIDGSLTEKPANGSEWYVLALAQHGSYDFSSYEQSLLSYLRSNSVGSASSRLKFALCLSAIGSTDNYIAEVMNEAIGKQGIISLVFGLHLLNNGYISDNDTLSTLTEKILSMQLSDGGWAIMGGYGDVDTTAMTIQAFAPAYGTNDAVTNAVDRGLTFLSEKQKEDGDYASYGITNPDSTAQVLVALSALHMDCMRDSRFIKSGNTLFDGIRKYRLSDGSFCHQQGGSKNALATMQVFYAMVSYQRMINGQNSLYLLDHANHMTVVPPIASTAPPTEHPIATDFSVTQTQAQEKTAIATETTVAEATVVSEKADTVSSTDIAAGSATVTNHTETQQTHTTSNEALNSAETDESADEESFPFRLMFTFVVIGIGGIACVVLLLKKKGTRRTYLLVLAATVTAAILIHFISFENSDTPIIGQVTITIRCDTLVGKAESAYIPQDGIILDVTSYDIAEGDTVYNVLFEAARAHNIHFEKEGNAGTTYISGIHNLYEFAYGDLSGWMYYVNGESPPVGCGAYRLSSGDAIEWHYTCDLGRDIL